MTLRRWVSRMAVICSLIVAGLAVPSAAQAGVFVVAKKCAGTDVVRCVELRYDEDHLRIRAHASVFDNGGDNRNYDVAVNEIGFWRSPVDAYNGEHNGWHTLYDVGMSELVGCFDFMYVPIRVTGLDLDITAHFQWRGHSTGSQTLTVRASHVCRSGDYV